MLKAAGIAPARIEGVPPRAIPLHPAAARLAVPAGGAPHAGDRSRRRAPPCGRTCALRRPTEIDYLQGAILALADKAGVAAPITERMLRLVKGAESAGAGSPGLRPDAGGERALKTDWERGRWTQMPSSSAAGSPGWSRRPS